MTTFSSANEKLEILPEPIVIEENYEIIGFLPGYSLPLKNKYVPSQTYAPMRKFCGDEYALSNVSDLAGGIRSHRKYAAVCRLRDVAFIESFDEDEELDDLIWDLFAPGLRAKRCDSDVVIGFQNMSKGAGFGCSSIVKTCWENNPHKLYEAMEQQDLYFDEVPINQSLQKLEVRLKTKDCRCYEVQPLWLRNQMQSFTKLQNLQFQEARFKIPSAVGISMPMGWIQLHDHLHRYATTTPEQRRDPTPEVVYFLCTWDIEKFDSMQPRALFWRDKRVRARGLQLTKQELDELAHLYYNTTNRVTVLPDGSVVFVKDGMISGGPNTTTDNIINHTQIFAMMWKKHTGRLVGFKDFITVSGFLLFGDDGICAIHNKRHENFFRAVPRLMKEIFGCNVTVEFHTKWSDAHFLGSQPLGDEPPLAYLSKPYDIPRQMTNLVEKEEGGERFDPIKCLQRGLGHRNLLAFTWICEDHEELDLLVQCMKVHVEKYDPIMANDALWVKLRRYALMSHEEFEDSLAYGLTGLERIETQSLVNVLTLRNNMMTKTKGQKMRRVQEVVVVKAQPKAQPKRKKHTNPSTGNVVGKIAEGVVSAVPVVGPFLGPLAGAVAGGLTNAITGSDWSGSGDYKIKSNSFIDKKTGATITRIPGTDGSTTFKYREFIGNVIASPNAGDFAHQAVRINPADSETFSWLGDAANKYGQYKLKGMIGILESQTSMTAPDGGSSLGRWGINAQYNPALQEGFTTLNENLQADGGKHAVTTQSIEVGFECAPRKTVAPDGLYCSAGPPPAGMNYAQTDPFVINIWSEGVEEANAVLGTFSLLYEFEFMKKTLTPASTSLLADLFQGEVDIQESCFLGSEIVNCAENTLGGTAEFSATINEIEPGVLYKFPDNVNFGRYQVIVTTDIMGSAANFVPGQWYLYPNASCSINRFVMSGNPADDFPDMTHDGAVTAIGPYGGGNTATFASGQGLSVCFVFFVDVTAGGAEIGIVWNGVTATSMPSWAGLSVTSFPRVVQFGVPLSLSKRVLFKNGASVNRLAMALETAASTKEVAKITRHIRSNLAAKGLGTDDRTVLRNIHNPKHRDILKQHDFGRKKEVDTAVQDEIALLRAAVLGMRANYVPRDFPFGPPPSAPRPTSSFTSWTPSPEFQVIAQHTAENPNWQDNYDDELKLLEIKLKRARKEAKKRKKEPSPEKTSMSYVSSQTSQADQGLTSSLLTEVQTPTAPQ